MSTTEQKDLARRLSLALGSLNRRIRPAGEGLSLGLVSALSTVIVRDGIRASDLAKCEKIAAPSATRLIADLEARGLVTREADPSDGRATLIRASAAGREAIESARDERAERLLKLLGAVPDVSHDQLRVVVEVVEALLAPG